MRALVVIADIIGSRRLEAGARRAVQERILALEAGPSFRVSGGDEFEWALPDAPASLDRVLRMRLALGIARGPAPAVDLRCALGRGEVVVTSDQGPYAEDGPAYHRARAAMDQLRAAPDRLRRSPSEPLAAGAPPVRWTAWVDAAPHPERDALLLHMDRLISRWSVPQRQAIHRVLDGATYEDVGQALGISAQAVQGRLKAADLALYLTGHRALKAAWERK